MSRSKATLAKTSVQLPVGTMKDMEAWPGLTRSEAIRLSVERAFYLATISAEDIAGIADRYAPILIPALEDLDYGDFRSAVRALPSMVEGFVRENRDVTWRDGDSREQLNPSELLEILEKLDAIGRIGLLDCVVAARHRPPLEEVLPRVKTTRRSRRSSAA